MQRGTITTHCLMFFRTYCPSFCLEISDPPLWNGVPMVYKQQSMIDEVKGLLPSPFELPKHIEDRMARNMYGTTKVNAGDNLELKRNMTAYMIRDNTFEENKDVDGWQKINESGDKKVYAKLMEKGTHNFSDNEEMFFLYDNKYGNIVVVAHTI